MGKLQGLIPAAGKGVRARPYTYEVHKGMLDINGSPNIERIVAIMRDSLEIEEIVIVVGYLGDSIISHFGDGRDYGVSINYIKNQELDKGLAWSILLAQDKITADEFCIMLCDECYVSSNHSHLLRQDTQNHLVTCCGTKVEEKALIEKNYSIALDADRHVLNLVEKPTRVTSDVMGTGTFLCRRGLFSQLEAAYESSTANYVEFVNFLNDLHQESPCLGYFEIEGTYVNINDRDSLYLAKYNERKRIFSDCDLSLLIYSEGGEENIDFTIKRYAELGVFHSISVILPATSTITDQVEACGVNAIVCPSEVTLYGEKLKYGMEQVTQDIIVLTEADYSFASSDVEKLLTYLPEADMVVGTRTTRQLIEQGSNMRGLVRLANSALGHLVEFLWWNRRSRFTDVGCTFRAIWKNSFESVAPQLNSAGPEFSAEMMIALIDQHQRVIEIPVSYYNRSRLIQKKYQSIWTFFRITKLILGRRLTTLF